MATHRSMRAVLARWWRYGGACLSLVLAMWLEAAVLSAQTEAKARLVVLWRSLVAMEELRSPDQAGRLVFSVAV